ncbi:DUF7507 domain-containing protein [Microbacterium sp. NRRL B-14842]
MTTVGEILEYSFVVTNTGNVTLADRGGGRHGLLRRGRAVGGHMPG